MSDRPRVIVCGTGFGRVHLAALERPGTPFELAGVLARGGERSRLCAERAGVPLFTDVDETPDDVDLACVVLLADVNGGPGSQVAARLMERGVHVLQEAPLLHDELAASLRAARRNRVVFRVNTHYVHLDPVRRFVAAARTLLARGPALFVDAACGVQVSYTMFDILGQALGGLRPWGFAEPGGLPEAVRRLSESAPPFRTVEGVLAGVPLTLRVQNQLHPADPDNHAHLLHRITLGTEGGTLTLVNTHGPVLWSPRPHLPARARELTALDGAEDEHLDFPSCVPIGPARAPSYREILGEMWPAGAGRAIDAAWEAVRNNRDPLKEGQYHLSVSKAWQDVAAVLGYPERLAGPPPSPLSAGDLMSAMSAEHQEVPL
ncbi:Gfo/Idh/MocA family oxidoreductase [Streptosporangium sp. NPDC023963]|uniref:Gfo/Idh/MocA family oxidoreductase n=1 Tax=unclassified Streptosporangium TaxID=2632669 RepID=UPI00344171C9